MASLAEARALARKIRFSGDTEGKPEINDCRAVDAQREVLAQRGVEISPTITPLLSETLGLVSERLLVPGEAISAYVYASPELQASCYSAGTDDCVLSFSSSLVDLLSPEEIQYVAGHEIGHFIFRHGISSETLPDSVEFLMESRAKEISADRFGFLACQSLDIALRAMIKTASGLDDRHLRFDVRAFLSQIDETPGNASQLASRSTHPSWVVRARALLWFSMSDGVSRGSNHFSSEELIKIDGNIDRDLERFVDGAARERIRKAKFNVKLWLMMREIVADGKFDKREQEIIRSNFGDDLPEKLIGLFENLGADEVLGIVVEKYEEAARNLASLLPGAHEREIAALRESVAEIYFVK